MSAVISEITVDKVVVTITGPTPSGLFLRVTTLKNQVTKQNSIQKAELSRAEILDSKSAPGVSA